MRVKFKVSRPCSELQSHIATCPFNTTPWTSQGHHRFIVCRTGIFLPERTFPECQHQKAHPVHPAVGVTKAGSAWTATSFISKPASTSCQFYFPDASQSTHFSPGPPTWLHHQPPASSLQPLWRPRHPALSSPLLLPHADPRPLC